MFNFKMLCDILNKDLYEIIIWCQQKELVLRKKQCNVCNNDMKLLCKEPNTAFWRCHKQIPYSHDIQKSVFENTIFFRSKFNIKSTLILMYKFSNGETNYESIKKETSNLNIKTSDQTISHWLSIYREICYLWMDKCFDTQGIRLG
jgi:hypothetical protein